MFAVRTRHFRFGPTLKSKHVYSAKSSHPSFNKRNLQIETISPEESERRKEKLKRHLPTSPHVTIFKFPLPAITSITHRITGVALYAGFTAIGLSALSSPESAAHLVDYFNNGFAISLLSRTAVAFPLYYHYFNAFRHFVWDSKAIGLDNLNMEKSSREVLYLSSGATGLTVLASYIFG